MIFWTYGPNIFGNMDKKRFFQNDFKEHRFRRYVDILGYMVRFLKVISQKRNFYQKDDILDIWTKKIVLSDQNGLFLEF